MDALNVPDMSRSLSSPIGLTATMNAEEVEDLSNPAVAESFREKNAEEASFPQQQTMPVERSKQSEVLDTAPGSPASYDPASQQAPGISPTVGAYTAQCANCMKWRLIPTKAQFEAIRHSILDRPFFCSSASPWHPNASCKDPFEISPDVHELWAFDKPGIPLPPNGWERLLVIRPAGSVKFGDIYYMTPSGKKIRSMPELERFLSEHPGYSHEVNLSQFSFLLPRPLERDYSKKKIETQLPGERITSSGKRNYHKSVPTDSHLTKVGPVQNSRKVTSSKPNSKKLKFRKKAVGVSNLLGERQVAKRSSVFRSRQCTKSPMSQQTLATFCATNGANATPAIYGRDTNGIGNSANQLS